MKLNVKPAGQTAEDDRIFEKGAKDGEVVGSNQGTKQSKRGSQAGPGNWPYRPDSTR